MKYLLLTGLCLILFSCSLKSLSTPEELGEAIFRSIKTDDLEAMQSLAIENDEWYDLSIQMGADEDRTQRELDEMEERYPQGGNYISNENIPYNYTHLRKNLIRGHGPVDWSQVKYEQTYSQIQTRQGVEGGEILVEVSYEGEDFYFLSEVIKTSRAQWKIIDDTYVVDDPNRVRRFKDESDKK